MEEGRGRMSELENERRTSANRRNAEKSTGPQTEEGKALVSRNATKHGLLSRETLLPNEDGSALEVFSQNLRAELSPVGELENLLVDRIISASWRLRRVLRVEGEIFSWEELGKRVEQFQKEAGSYASSSLDFGNLLETRITDARKHQAALQKVKDVEAQRQALTVGPAFVRDGGGADAFSKLSRYETSIERSLYRALHELQRLQALRAGQPVPPPVAVDMDMNVSVGAD